MKNLTIFCAGCFRFVISELASVFKEQFKLRERPEHFVGASGLMAKKIQSGSEADVFLSANKRWAVEVQRLWKSENYMVCSNDLVILTSREEHEAHQDSLQLLADPNVILGFTDPNLDPSGQYAAEKFLPKIASVYPELYASLKKRCFVIGKEYLEQKLPVGQTLPQSLLDTRKIQAMVVYGSGARSGRLADGLAVFSLPSSLEVRTECFGIAKSEKGSQFLDFCLSSEGQRILKKYGFLPI